MTPEQATILAQNYGFEASNKMHLACEAANAAIRALADSNPDNAMQFFSTAIQYCAEMKAADAQAALIREIAKGL